MTQHALSEISLKSLKAAEIVARMQSVTRAAEYLNRSQTAISKSILTLEQRLEVNLFDRSISGMALTSYGKILVLRIEEAQCQFDAAALAYKKIINPDLPIENNPIFSMNVSFARLQALLDVFKAHSVKEAAQQSETTSAALYSSIHILEGLLNTTLFERTSLGNEPTPFCVELVRHVQLAFKVLQEGIAEITHQEEQLTGAVKIAAFPSVRNYLLPQACLKMKQQNPDVLIQLKDGMYQDMEGQVRNGELDFLVSAFYMSEHNIPNDLFQQEMFKAPLRLIVKADHELFSLAKITEKDLKDFSWVLPPTGTGARKAHESILSNLGIDCPNCLIEAYSYTMQKEILINSDCIGISFEHQYDRDEYLGVILPLPFDLGQWISIGFTLRRNTTLSAPARSLQQALLEMADKLKH